MIRSARTVALAAAPRVKTAHGPMVWQARGPRRGGKGLGQVVS
ncbi:MAG: hypothetical protein JWO62_574 [Acidimicrobiaceae bacterium]|nr:hypothetical protein [Acidimicrobiaceae bacterium]